MIYLLILLVFLILILIGYIMFLRMFKYAFLLMCANDKNAISNLTKNSNPFEKSLSNRDIPLSIYLNMKNTYSKFVKSNLLFIRIDDFLSKYTIYNNDYEYMQEIENTIDSKLNEWDDLTYTKFKEQYFTQFYYLKTAIIIRLFFALKNIKPNTSLENWKQELINYNDFKDDILMQRIYFSICNEEISKTKILTIENSELSSTEIKHYITSVSQTDLKSYVSHFFYWHKNG